MKNLGILLAFAPEQQISNQGISRLLAFIMSATLAKDDTQITIAIPAWYKKMVLELLRDHHIDASKIEFITTSGIPYLIRVRSFLLKLKLKSLKPNNGFLGRVKRWVSKKSFSLLMKWLSSGSFFIFFSLLPVVMLLGLVAAPFVLIGLLFFFVAKLIKMVTPKIEKKVFANKKAAKSWKLHFLAPLKKFKHNALAHQIYNHLRKLELQKLAVLINKRPDIPVWFVPTLFWPEIDAIHAKKVVAAPDIICIDFPSQFAEIVTAQNFAAISKTLEVADHLICYSDFVKYNHLCKYSLVNPEKVSVIKHGAVNLLHYFDESAKHPIKHARLETLSILQDYQRKSLVKNDYLANFNFTHIKFMLYPSQVRPHKNILSLVKAYEYLLRHRFINIKLILTGDISEDALLNDYIQAKGLQYDVLVFHEIPSLLLAALNHLAVCVVNPTLFEGGFPFTFTEGYSVGTPSVMSNIPMVACEIESEQLKECMLFDPFNIHDMAAKMEWAVLNRQALIDLQKPLYEKFAKRSWEVVANEYTALFDKIGAENDKIS